MFGLNSDEVLWHTRGCLQPWTWQLQCLRKQWTAVNIRHGLYPKAEGSY